MTTHSTPHGIIITDYWPKPIPVRTGDWSAVLDNYDGAPDSHCPIGYGATEAEAMQELIDQIEERKP